MLDRSYKCLNMSEFESYIRELGHSRLTCEQNLLIQECGFQIHISDYEKPLIFTFDDVSYAGPILGRSCWGYDYLKGQGFNVIGIMESDKFGWFRSDSIGNIISILSESPLLDIFPVIMGYGTSMGGYAAAVFSEPLRMDRCLLLSPISSLNSALVPWENRYKEGAKKDWAEEASDGARTSYTRKYIVYDPLVLEDRRHAERFSFNSPEVLTLRTPGFGHSTAAHLNSLGGLGSLFQDVLNDNFCPNKFFNLMRGRKRLDKYYVNIISKLLARKSTKSRSLMIVFTAFLKYVFGKSKSSMQALEIISRLFKSLKLEEELEYFSGFGGRVFPGNVFFKSIIGQADVGCDRNYESLFFESVRLRREGFFMDSIKVSLECFDLSNKNTRPLRQIADIYRLQGLKKEAELYADWALSIEPELKENLDLKNKIK